MEAAAGIFRSEPTEAEAARFGLTVEEASGPPVEIWPDTYPAVLVFSSLMTQWRRAGMTGAVVGLDYAVIPTVFRLRGIPRHEWEQTFDDLRVMEGAALEHLNKK